MDGTQAGFYYEPAAAGASEAARTGWVVHLQGGGECTDEALCSAQLSTKRGSSNYWDPYKNRMMYDDSIYFEIRSLLPESEMQIGEMIWFLFQSQGILITDGLFASILYTWRSSLTDSSSLVTSSIVGCRLGTSWDRFSLIDFLILERA